MPVWSENQFAAGRLARPLHRKFWETVILEGHPRKEFILKNLECMRPSRFFRRFTGRFKGVDYDSEEPPQRAFSNNFGSTRTSTGERAEDWAAKKVAEDVATGAIRCLGRVGEVDAPRVVLPLSVEPSKPRLITDARYVNLWCDAGSFSLDSVGQVPEVFRREGFFCNYDHKSGYHAHPFAEEEQGWFGFELKGFYYVFAAGCFGWNCMPEIYHVTHAALLRFCQTAFGIPSLAYLDDALSGSLWDGGSDEWSLRRSAAWAIRVLVWVNFLAGYTVSVRKSVLVPCKVIVWLGIQIDGVQKKFFIPQENREKFHRFLVGIMARGRISVRELQRVAGKCISLQLAVGEASKVFTRAFFDLLARIERGELCVTKGSVAFGVNRHKSVHRALTVWVSILHRFEGMPWMRTEHDTIRVQTDASSIRWGGVLKTSDGATALTVGEEFAPEELGLDIETKEAMAVVRVLQGIMTVGGEAALAGKRVNVWIDNQALVFAMLNGASRNKTVHAQLEQLFWVKVDCKCMITPIWWDTKANWEADGVTRVLKDDDWRLCREAFLQVWDRFGPFDMDLMASSVNVQSTPSGSPLPFYSRFLCAGSARVGLLAQDLGAGAYYCFPHRSMVGPVVAYLSMRRGVRVALIVRAGDDSAWRPRLRAAVRVNQHILPAGSVVTVKGVAVANARFVCWMVEF